MAPAAEAVGIAPFTLGDSTSVFPSRLTGMPLPGVAAMAITIDQGVLAPAMTTVLTYLLDR